MSHAQARALAGALHRIDPWLREIAETVGHGAPGAKLRVELVKAGLQSQCFKVHCGEGTAFLKIFSDADPAGWDHYRRESRALSALRASGLTVTALIHCDPGMFVLTDHVDGRTAAEIVDRIDPLQVARLLGRWLARYDAAAPRAPAECDWFTYLARYGTTIDQNPIAAHCDRLARLDMPEQGLARCDCQLTNYILPRSGPILACDFEKARLKPRGWDYLMTYQSLAESAPDRAPAILRAMGEGFAAEHDGTLSVDDLNWLAVIVAEAMKGSAVAA